MFQTSQLEIATPGVTSDSLDELLDRMTFNQLTKHDEFYPEFFGYPELEAEDHEQAVMFHPSEDKAVCLVLRPWQRVFYPEVDPKDIRKFLAYRSEETVSKTLGCTTQLIKAIYRFPMRKHFKARHPAMNVHRLSEVVSTDPIFANCKAASDGSTGANIFYGLASKCIDIFPFKKKSEFPKNYKDFILQNGAPSALRRDNAKEEQSEEIQDIHRKYLIQDQFSEPHNQQQNPVESGAIRWIKTMVHVLLDHTGAPDVLWLMAALYLAYVWKRTWHPQLNMTPHQFRNGVPPDISSLLQFSFFQKVLYLDHEDSWPSTKERAGRWVGVAENIGDSLTYWILDEQSKQILARSVVRPFADNYRVQWDSAFLKQLKSKHTAQHGGEVWHPRVDTSLEDEHDMAEPVPKQHPICVTQNVRTPKPSGPLTVLLQSALHTTGLKPSPLCQDCGH